MPISPELILSVAAIAGSAGTYVFTHGLSKKVALTQIRPVLVFTLDGGGWAVKNVGNGPALNIQLSRRTQGWTGATGAGPLGVGDSIGLSEAVDWSVDDDASALGATYTNIEGDPYATRVSLDAQHTTTLVEGGLPA